MEDDRPVLGIVLMLGFCATAPLGDAVAKLLTGVVPLLQLLLVRFAMQGLLLAPFLIRRRPALTPRLLGHIAWRTLLHMIGIGTMFTALFYLPLADAIAIAFVLPFIMLLIGKFILNEAVGPRRLAACVVGFAGTLMVIQPSFVEVGIPAVLPALVAFIFALFILSTRRLSRQIDAVSLQAISGLMALVFFLGLMLVPGVAAEMLTPPSSEVALLLLLVGLIGTAAHLLMTWSLRFAPSATLAPLQYMEIPFATTIGFLIFKDLPDGLALLGIMVTISAGLYILHRERIDARLAAAAAPAV